MRKSCTWKQVLSGIDKQNEVLPKAVWDKDGNEYRRLSGEYGNDEFIKCD